MKLGWKMLIGLGILLTLLGASLFVTFHVQPVREVDAYRKTLRAQGEKLNWSEIRPPAVAAADNSAETVQQAFSLFDGDYEKVPYAMKLVAPGRALIGWQQPDARNSDFTNSWDEFGAKVDADRGVFRLMREVLVRPKLEFPSDEKDVSTSLFTNLVPMKRAVQKLDGAAVLALHRGDPGTAATNIITTLALVQKNAGQGLEICHLVRLAMANIAVIPTWELLQSTNVSAQQLAAVQSAWQQLDLLRDAENALLWERAWSSAQSQESRASHKGFTNVFGGWIDLGGSGGGSGSVWPDMLENVTQGPRLAVSEELWRSSWSYEDELDALKGTQIALDAVRSMETNRSGCLKTNYDTMTIRLASLWPTNSGGAWLERLKIPDFRRVFSSSNVGAMLRKTLLTEALRDLTVSAIALKRYQLQHSRLPDALAELVPEFLPAVPIDPYDGKLLKYRPNEDGTFLLYSVGDDGVDDGGDSTPVSGKLENLSWLRGRDWVWPQPASAAEVENFFAHPPK